MRTLQQDSIAQQGSASSVAHADSNATEHFVLTPRTVLSWLPRSATPAQQDSAIQAHFKPGPIRWSNRPDTLHLPGHDKGHNMLDVQLPQYYREGFFSKDSLFHPELPGGRYGMAGDPVPYTAHGDNIITSLLLVSFIMAVVSVASAKGFIARQAKSFFYKQREGITEVTETTTELYFQGFLVVLTCLLMALLFYFNTTDYGDTLTLPTPYHLIAIYLAMTAVYWIAKVVLYSVVNSIFFGGKRNGQWIKSLLFITSLEGVLIFPLVLLQAYLDLGSEKVLTGFVIVLVFVKLLTIFKTYIIFFRQNVVQLQIILYFCTLEIIPLLAFWGALGITANSLKINF